MTHISGTDLTAFDIPADTLTALTELNGDYRLTVAGPDGKLQLGPRYRDVSHAQSDYILWLVRLGRESYALRVAGCFRLGSVRRRCRRGHFAVAYHLRCYDPLCHFCARSTCRLWPWLAKRNIEGVLARAHTGIELALPRLVGESLGAAHDRIQSLASILLSSVSDSVSHTVLDPNVTDIKLRILVADHADRKDLIRRWRQIAGWDAWLRVRYARPGAEVKELFRWCFSALEPAATMSGRTRAELRVALDGRRLVRTTGTLYHVLPKEQIKAQCEAHDHADPSQCPLCQDLLENVPQAERRIDEKVAIIASYEHVWWSSGNNPVSERVICNAAITAKFEDWPLKDRPVGNAIPRWGPN
jgi:hypothetical protein